MRVFRKSKPIILALAAILVTTIVLAGCGSDDGGGGSGVDNAKTLDSNAAEGASGDVTWCIGKDTSGSFTQIVNAHNKSSQVNVKLVELPTSADEQRTQQIQRLRAKSSDCDILGMDVVWTAEYASQGWLYDLSSVVDKRSGDFIPSTLDTAEYEGKDWAVPFNTNAGFVYYRKSQAQAPKSWEELYDKAKQTDGLAYQGFQYEGLTVNFLELLYSAGGKAVSDDGKSSEINSDQAKQVLRFMVEGIKDGAVPKAVLTYQEQETRRAFEAGKVSFQRNWPYAYALAKDSDIADDFDIATFPGYGGNKGAGVIGGYNLGISAYSKNAEGALEFVDYATSPAAQKLMMTKSTLPAVLTQTYSDADVQKAVPFATQLLKAVEQAQPRPISPVYPQINEAINKNVHEALSGDKSPDAAIEQADKDIQKALETF
jgi:multiple sugar transport system substrate-binding protein